MADKRLSTVGYRPTHTRATVIDCTPGFEGPYFRGEGSANSVCGHCNHVLVEGEVVAMMTLYVCCPNCGNYNLVDGHDAAMA